MVEKVMPWLVPAGFGAWVQKLREDNQRNKLNAAIERSNAEESRRSMAEYEAYRADPDGNDRWLRERAGSIDPNNL